MSALRSRLLWCSVPAEHENYMKNLISVGGILVMPLNDQLLQIRRTGETTWETKNVLPVSFASLISPNKDNMTEVVDLPEAPLSSLQELCRVSIRRILRSFIHQEHPDLNHRPKRQKKPKKKRRRQQQLNVVPMSMGMMILGQFEESDTSDVENEKQFDSDQSHSDGELQEASDTLEKSDREDDDDVDDGYDDAVRKLSVPGVSDNHDDTRDGNNVELLEVDSEVKSGSDVDMNGQKASHDRQSQYATPTPTVAPNHASGKTAIKRVGRVVSTRLGEISSLLKSDVKQNTPQENEQHRE
ncbi:hypothetical protein ScPMuIL_006196 [Solemya velum]